MQVSPLKAGLVVMPIVGLIAFLYVLFSAMDSGQEGPLDSYAHGEMRAFITLDTAPLQPEIVYTGASDTEVRLSDYQGKVILVNFWATWCPPCVQEMPALDNLQATLGGDDFEVVTISLDRSVDDARAFYERMELANLPLIHDASFSSPGLVGALGLPMSILYDRQGNEMGRVPAPAEWDSEETIALIEAAIRLP